MSWEFKSEYPNPQTQVFYDLDTALDFCQHVVLKTGGWEYIGQPDETGRHILDDYDEVQQYINQYYGIKTAEEIENEELVECACDLVEKNLLQMFKLKLEIEKHRNSCKRSQFMPPPKVFHYMDICKYCNAGLLVIGEHDDKKCISSQEGSAQPECSV